MDVTSDIEIDLPQVGGCGCGCCGPEEGVAPTRGEEIAELKRLRDAIDERLGELDVSA